MKTSKTLFAGIAIAVGAGLAAPTGADAQEEVVEYRQSLMQADPPLFNLRYGKSQREGLIPNSPSSVVDPA